MLTRGKPVTFLSKPNGVEGLLMNNMEVQHLFDSSGFWIAFRVGRHVFDANGIWVGWLPWDENEVVNTKGIYLGHIYPDNRFYRNFHYLKRECIDRPNKPPYIHRQTFPGSIGPSRLPIGAQDLRLSAHV